MGKIERWTNEKKIERKNKIGSYIPCPICLKINGLSIWEGERFLKCQFCGADYKKKQFYNKNKMKKHDKI